MKLFLDIETLPAPPDKHELVLGMLKEPPEDADERAEAIALTSLHAEFGRILCIGYWCEPEMTAPDVLTGDEPAMLSKFWEIARRAGLYIGHNLLDFDLPFLIKRSIIHRVKPHPISLVRYRKEPVYDTMQIWSNWDRADKCSLDKLAKALGLETSKKGIDGSMVAGFHEAGRDAEIFAYCKDDVRLVREVYRRMTFES